MAIIQSGAGTDTLTVDSISKAARATLYRSDGSELYEPAVGGYILPIQIIQSAATASGNTVFAMRADPAATRIVEVTKIRGAVSFAGTAAAGTSIGYAFRRFSGATPTGGSAGTIIKKVNSYPASQVTDNRFVDTGLTMTGATLESPFSYAYVPVSVTSTVRFADFHMDPNEELILQAGEGFAITLATNAIIGMAFTGWIEWHEV